jgi:hypothetical protein
MFDLIHHPLLLLPPVKGVITDRVYKDWSNNHLTPFSGELLHPTSGAGNAYPSGASKFTPVLVGFIVLFVIRRDAHSDYPIGIFKLFLILTKESVLFPVRRYKDILLRWLLIRLISSILKSLKRGDILNKTRFDFRKCMRYRVSYHNVKTQQYNQTRIQVLALWGLECTERSIARLGPSE